MKWNKLKEKYPKIGNGNKSRPLVFITEKQVLSGRLCRSIGANSGRLFFAAEYTGAISPEDVTHWMYLPKLPKGQLLIKSKK